MKNKWLLISFIPLAFSNFIWADFSQDSNLLTQKFKSIEGSFKKTKTELSLDSFRGLTKDTVSLIEKINKDAPGLASSVLKKAAKMVKEHSDNIVAAYIDRNALSRVRSAKIGLDNNKKTLQNTSYIVEARKSVQFLLLNWIQLASAFANKVIQELENKSK